MTDRQKIWPCVADAEHLQDPHQEYSTDLEKAQQGLMEGVRQGARLSREGGRVHSPDAQGVELA